MKVGGSGKIGVVASKLEPYSFPLSPPLVVEPMFSPSELLVALHCPEPGSALAEVPQRVLISAVDAALHAPETFPQDALATVRKGGTKGGGPVRRCTLCYSPGNIHNAPHFSPNLPHTSPPHTLSLPHRPSPRWRAASRCHSSQCASPTH